MFIVLDAKLKPNIFVIAYGYAFELTVVQTVAYEAWKNYFNMNLILVMCIAKFPLGLETKKEIGLLNLFDIVKITQKSNSSVFFVLL